MTFEKRYTPWNKGKKTEPAIRFWQKVLKTESCWLWMGHKGKWGHGQFSDENRKIIYAYVFSYKIHKGDISEGLEIDHLCRNPACVNPNHLEAVTHKENVLRGVGIVAQCAKKTHCPQGHPYSGENLVIKKDGARACRICTRQQNKIRTKNWYIRNKEKGLV